MILANCLDHTLLKVFKMHCQCNQVNVHTRENCYTLLTTDYF